MIQEILTYMILGSAVTVAVMKLTKKFSIKKRRKNTDLKKPKFTMQHNCSECSAECILRNSSKYVLEADPSLCKKADMNLD